MLIRMAIFTLSTLATVCQVQGLNISGTVKNGAGNGIEGVMVRLGKADTATTTGPDGSFTLKNNITGITHRTDQTVFCNDCPRMLEDNRLVFSSVKQAEIRVMIYDCNGRLMGSLRKVVASGDHSIPLPPVADGIHIYRVFLNNERYTMRSVTGIAANRGPASSWKETSRLAKQTKAVALFDDALIFTKSGYQLYRIALTKPETTGLQITMIPLDTGTMTDGEGNVYKTVRIGNQYWTAENLRSTKYNDGSGAAYSFYKNVTDAAAKKKWGALYSYAAVKTGKLAPTGWHVSTDAEWDTLQCYLMANGYNYDGTVSVLDRGKSESDDNKIAKSLSAKTDWTPTAAGVGVAGAIGNDLSKNDASGFSALPSGYRSFDGNFYDQGNYAFFWTATEHDASYAWYRFFWSVCYDISRGDRVKTLECSVRLVRNK
jgi:uncharacterized protein (TIGR02145 family)